MPATIADLKSAFPKDPAFALDCAERGIELVEARAEYADIVKERAEKDLAEAQARISQLEKDHASAQNKIEQMSQEQQKPKRGTPPAPEPNTSSSNALSAVDEVRERMQPHLTRGMSEHDAHARVMRADPTLRERYVAEHQSRRMAPA